MIWDGGEPRIALDGDAVDGGRPVGLRLLGSERRRAPSRRATAARNGRKRCISTGWKWARRPPGGAGAGGSGLGAGQGPEGQPLAVGRDIHLDLVAPAELAHEDLLAERILDVLLDRPLERPGAVVLVVAVLDQEVDRGRA